jgi:hypothetical protein
MAAITLYPVVPALIGSAPAPSFWHGITDTMGTTGVSTLCGWTTTATTSNGKYAMMRAMATVAATSATTSQLGAISVPTPGTGAAATTTGQAFRSEFPYKGTVAAGTWTANMVLKSTFATAMNVTVRVRIWRSVNENGSSGTELTSGAITASSSTLANTAQTISPSVSLGSITLDNEYLFFAVELLVNTTTVSASVLIQSDTNFVTPNFTSAQKIFWLTNTTPASPGFFGALQEDGTPPSQALSTTAFTLAKTAVTTRAYWTLITGGTNTATGGTSSQIDSRSGPLAGTTGTAGGDAYRTPTALTGTFTGTWQIALIWWMTSLSITGQFRCRVAKSANANGSSATYLTTSTLVSPSTANSTQSSNLDAGVIGNQTVMKWQPGSAITLSNEYLFFEIEWQETVAGSANGSNLKMLLGSAAIFAPNLVTATVYDLAIDQASLGLTTQTITANRIRNLPIAQASLALTTQTITPRRSKNLFVDALRLGANTSTACTLNPADADSAFKFENGNMTAFKQGLGDSFVRATKSRSNTSGSYFFAMKLDAGTVEIGLGLANSSATLNPGGGSEPYHNTNALVYQSNGYYNYNTDVNGPIGSLTTFSNLDTVGLSWNAATNVIKIYKIVTGAWSLIYTSAASPISGGVVYPFFTAYGPQTGSIYGSGDYRLLWDKFTVNFNGQDLPATPNGETWWTSGNIGKGTAWTPAVLSPSTLAAWHHTNSTAETVKNIDYTNSLVNASYDQSGNNRTEVQATTANKPSIWTNTYNGGQTMLFYGGNAAYLDSSLDLSALDQVAFIWLVQPTNLGVIRTLVGSSVTGGLQFRITTGGGLQFIKQTVAALTGAWGTVSTTTANIVVGMLDRVTGYYTFRLNGTDLVVNGVGNQDPGGGYLVNLATGGHSLIGRNGTTSGEDWDGFLMERITLASVDTTLVKKAEGYIANKWGVTSLLPSDHPYKNTPPTTDSMVRGTKITNTNVLGLNRVQLPAAADSSFAADGIYVTNAGLTAANTGIPNSRANIIAPKTQTTGYVEFTFAQASNAEFGFTSIGQQNLVSDLPRAYATGGDGHFLYPAACVSSGGLVLGVGSADDIFGYISTPGSFAVGDVIGAQLLTDSVKFFKNGTLYYTFPMLPGNGNALYPGMSLLGGERATLNMRGPFQYMPSDAQPWDRDMSITVIKGSAPRTITIDMLSLNVFGTTTLNPNDKAASIALSNNKLTATGSGGSNALVRATYGRADTTGSYFWSVYINGVSGQVEFGLINGSATTASDIASSGFCWVNFGIYGFGGQLNATSFSAGDTLGLQWLPATNTFKFYKLVSGAWSLIYTGTNDFGGVAAYPAISLANSGDIVTVNFSPNQPAPMPAGSTAWDPNATAVTPLFTRKVNVVQASLALNAQAVTVKASRKIAITQASLALNTQTVSPKVSRKIAIAQASLALTTQALTVKTARKLAIAQASLALTTQTVTPLFTRRLNITQASLALNTQTVSAIAARKLAITQASLAIIAEPVIAKASRKLAIAQASLALNAQTLSPLFTRKVNVTTANLALNTQNVVPAAARKIVIAQGTLSLNGQTVTLSKRFILSVAQASLALTTQTVNVPASRKLAVAQASLALTTQSVVVKASRKLAIAQASLALNTQSVVPAAARKLAIAQSSLALNAQTITPVRTRSFVVGQASIALTSFPVAPKASRKLSVAQSSLALSTQLMSLAAARKLAVAQTSLSLTNEPVSPLFTRRINVAQASLALTSEPLTLRYTRAFKVNTVTLTLTPQDILGTGQHVITISTLMLGLTSEPVATVAARKLPVAQTSLGLTSEPLTAAAARKLSVAQASLAITPETVIVKAARKFVVAQASLALTTETISPRFTRNLAVAQASLAITPRTVVVKAARVLKIDTGTLTLTLQDLPLGGQRSISIAMLALQITPETVAPRVSRAMAVATAHIDLTNEALALRVSRQLTVAPAALSLSSPDINAGRRFTLSIGPTSVSLSPALVALAASRALKIDTASIDLGSRPVTLSRALQLAVEGTSLAISAEDFGFSRIRNILISTTNVHFFLEPLTLQRMARYAPPVHAHLTLKGSPVLTATLKPGPQADATFKIAPNAAATLKSGPQVDAGFKVAPNADAEFTPVVTQD